METQTQPVQEWPESIKLLITWLEQTQLPQSFELHPGAVVKNGHFYKDHLLKMLEAGPTYEHAAAAANTLKQLHELFGNTGVKP